MNTRSTGGEPADRSQEAEQGGRSRRYRQVARAEAAARTERRIIDAGISCYAEAPDFDPPLEEIARRAEVSVRTVLRRFGSKDGLLRALIADRRRKVVEQRATAPTGDTAGAVQVLFDHYEAHGRDVLKLLAAEDRVPAVRELITDPGRRLHAEWVERHLAHLVARLQGRARRRRLAQLTAITDVWVWRLLRLDRDLGRPEAERAMTEMLEALGPTAPARADAAWPDPAPEAPTSDAPTPDVPTSAGGGEPAATPISETVNPRSARKAAP